MMSMNIIDSAAKVKLLALDVDGVLTDGSINISSDGELFKGFNAKDGLGISCLVRSGIKVIIITGRKSPIIRFRANELGITDVFEGVKDKNTALNEALLKYDLALEEIAYVGDDLNDLPVLVRAGLPCAPADAVAEVLEVACYISRANGGRGAVREVAELILKSKNKWKQIVESYINQGQGDAQ